jgi:hypothetical protein
VHEILGIGVDIFTTEEDMLPLDVAMPTGTRRLIDEILDPLRIVPHTEWLANNITIAVAEHNHMVLLGVVDRHTHNPRVAARFLKKHGKVLTSVLINVALLHGGVPPFPIFSCFIAD